MNLRQFEDNWLREQVQQRCLHGQFAYQAGFESDVGILISQGLVYSVVIEDSVLEINFLRAK